MAPDSIGPPDNNRSDVDGCLEVCGELVVAGWDASELFDPVEESLNEVPLPINPAREHEGALAVGLRRNVGPGLSLGGLGPDGIAVITLVGQQDVSLAELVRQRAASVQSAICPPVIRGVTGDLRRRRARGFCS